MEKYIIRSFFNLQIFKYQSIILENPPNRHLERGLNCLNVQLKDNCTSLQGYVCNIYIKKQN